MANGVLLDSVAFFDTLLANAWQRALAAYNKGAGLSAPALELADLQKWGVNYAQPMLRTPSLSMPYAAGTAQALERMDEDTSLRLKQYIAQWEAEVGTLLQEATPAPASFEAGLQWLRRAAAGEDVLGSMGQAAHEQLLVEMQTAAGDFNARGLPLPPRAQPALQAVQHQLGTLMQGQMVRRMVADRVQALIRLRYDALVRMLALCHRVQDAMRDYALERISYVPSVFGSNNQTLMEHRYKVEQLRSRLSVAEQDMRAYELGVDQTGLALDDRARIAESLNGQVLNRASLQADAFVRRMRKSAQQIASALNSANVGVGFTSSESNTVDEDA